MKKKRRVGVFIASENRLFRESLADRIAREQRFRVMGCVSGTTELLAQLKRLKLDLLLFDMDALGPVPESLLTRLQYTWPDLHILALAAQANDQEVARALRYGAAGLIGKNESLAKFLHAMEAVASGETWAGRKATARALAGLARDKRQSSPSSLTPRERQVFSLLKDGYRNKELASLLKVKEQTVKIHLHSLFRKLNVRTRVEAALKAAEQE